MRTIYKYPLGLIDKQTVVLPKLAHPLTVQDQDGVLMLWAIVDPGEVTGFYNVTICGTGRPLPPNAGEYIATVRQGIFVWHLFGAWV